MKTIFFIIFCFCLADNISAQLKPQYFIRDSIQPAEIDFLNSINKVYNYSIEYLAPKYLNKSLVTQWYNIDTITRDTLFLPIKYYWAGTKNDNRMCSDCVDGSVFFLDESQKKIKYNSTGMNGYINEEIRFGDSCLLKIRDASSGFYQTFNILHESDTIYKNNNGGLKIVTVKGDVIDSQTQNIDVVQNPCKKDLSIIIANTDQMTSLKDVTFLASFRVDSIIMKVHNPVYGVKKDQMLLRVIIDSIFFSDRMNKISALQTHNDQYYNTNLNVGINPKVRNVDYYYSDTIFIVTDPSEFKMDSIYLGVIRKNADGYYPIPTISTPEYSYSLRRYYNLELLLKMSINEVDTMFIGIREVQSQPYWLEFKYESRRSKKKYEKLMKSIPNISDPDHLLYDPFLYYLNSEMIKKVAYVP